MLPRHFTYYDLLMITPSATQEEIKKAYHNLSLIWHPDRAAGQIPGVKNKIDDIFKEIGKAYSILSNISQKAEYDSTYLAANSSIKKEEANHKETFAETYNQLVNSYVMVNHLSRYMELIIAFNTQKDNKIKKQEKTIALLQQEIADLKFSRTSASNTSASIFSTPLWGPSGMGMGFTQFHAPSRTFSRQEPTVDTSPFTPSAKTTNSNTSCKSNKPWIVGLDKIYKLSDSLYGSNRWKNINLGFTHETDADNFLKHWKTVTQEADYKFYFKKDKKLNVVVYSYFKESNKLCDNYLDRGEQMLLQLKKYFDIPSNCPMFNVRYTNTDYSAAVLEVNTATSFRPFK